MSVLGPPTFMYGTAWKEDRTAALTRLALEAGFRAVDTANQRKHYHEAGVGEGLAGAFADGLLARSDLFLQTKFTYRRGQDHRLPYEAAADPATQVAQSLASSLEHLGTDYLDSYVLHGPDAARGVSPTDWTVWRAMERAHGEGTVRHLGISNANLGQIQALWRGAKVQPTFVQNRCYARTGWDYDIRAFCRERGVVYQAFSLLTANERELRTPTVERIAAAHDATVAQVVFSFAMTVGMLPLTGTSSEAHMREDLGAAGLALTADEIGVIEGLAAPG